MSRPILCCAMACCALCLSGAGAGPDDAAAVEKQALDLADFVLGLKPEPLDPRYNPAELVERVAAGRYVRDMAARVYKAARRGLTVPLDAAVLQAAKESLAVTLGRSAPGSPAGELLIGAYIDYGFANLGASSVTGEDLAAVKAQAAEMRTALGQALRELAPAETDERALSLLLDRACPNMPVAACVLGDGGVPRPVTDDRLQGLKAEAVAAVRAAVAKEAWEERPPGALQVALMEADRHFTQSVRAYPLPRPPSHQELTSTYAADLDQQADRLLEDCERQTREAILKDMYGSNVDALEILDMLLRWAM